MGGSAIPCLKDDFDHGRCVLHVKPPQILSITDSKLHPNFALMFLVCTIGVIFFTIFVEHAVDHQHEKLKERAEIFMKLGAKVMEELMTLGLISMFIFFVDEAAKLKQTDWFLPLEVAHYLIVFVAIFYVTQSWALLKRLRRTCSDYDRALSYPHAELTKDVLTELRTRKALRRGHSSMKFDVNAAEATAAAEGAAASSRRRTVSLHDEIERRASSKIVSGRGIHGGGAAGDGMWSWMWWRFFSQTAEVLDLQLLKHSFITKHNLPEEFDFVRYLAHSLEDGVSQTLNISPKAWLCLMLLFVVVFFCNLALKPTKLHLLVSFIAVGWCLLLLQCTILFFALRARAMVVELSAGMEPEDCTLAKLALKALSVMPKGEGLKAAAAHCAGSKVAPAATNPTTAAAAEKKHGEGEDESKEGAPSHGAGAAHSGAVHSKKRSAHGPASIVPGEQKDFVSTIMQDYETKIIIKHWNLHETTGPDGKVIKLTKRGHTWPVHRTFVQKTLDFLFLVDCVYKAVWLVYFYHQHNKGGGFALLGLALLPSLLGTFVVSPLATTNFYLTNTLAKIKSRVLGATVEDMEEARQQKLGIRRKLHELHRKESPRGGEPDGEWLWNKFRGCAKSESAPSVATGSQRCCSCLASPLRPRAFTNHGDGKEGVTDIISKERMEEILTHLEIFMTDFKLTKLMRVMDPNGNGVEMQEFVNFLDLSSEECERSNLDPANHALGSTRSAGSSKQISSGARTGRRPEGPTVVPVVHETLAEKRESAAI